MSSAQPPRAPAQAFALFLRDLRAAFRGHALDLTEVPLARAILLLSIPMVLEMLGQSVFGLVDMYFVGRLGPAAVAAVGLTDELLTLVFAVGLGLAMATTALVARRIGEKDVEGAREAAAQALILGVGCSVAIAVPGAVYADEMLRLMGAGEAVVAAGGPYCAIIFGTNAVIFFLFLINAIFRGAGDAFLAMKALWLANVLNMVLDPLLIFGLGPFPELGIAGAAVATTLGRGVAVGYQLWALSRSRVGVRVRDVRLALDVLGRLMRVAGPAVVQYGVGMASWLFIFRILADFGAEVIAGYTIALRILIFALLPAWGMGNAAATLVGQNLGAGRPERAERSVWATALANAAFLSLAAAVMIAFDAALVRFFTADPGVIRHGADAIRIIGYTYVLFAFGLVMTQAFNGAGDTTTPTWINFGCTWVVQVPLAWGLAHPLELGPAGVFWAVAVSQALLALVAVAWFRRGAWKRVVV